MKVGLSRSTRSGNATQLCHGRSPRDICSAAPARNATTSPAQHPADDPRDVDPRVSTVGRNLQREEDPEPEKNALQNVLVALPGSHGGKHPERCGSWSRRVAGRSARDRIRSPRLRETRKIGCEVGTIEAGYAGQDIALDCRSPVRVGFRQPLATQSLDVDSPNRILGPFPTVKAAVRCLTGIAEGVLVTVVLVSYPFEIIPPHSREYLLAGPRLNRKAGPLVNQFVTAGLFAQPRAEFGTVWLPDG